ncbi:glycoside-pentoside-hexuronide (GPH):cation symporter [Paenibacillus sp. FSL R5-0527]|uniref:glycoside-pentoside-hexuronide (GPH):cation symporter n=1 Tax=Paenibacillus sp. FSL R5-0527 TaxID=2975321 RepID=UPI00097B69A7|nr:MFS transporter [Paenibacillus macerans]
MESNPKQKLPLKEKVAYGFGDLGNGFMFDLGQSYLLKFFTDVLNIPAVVGGTVFLISKIFDAFADVTVGTIVDSRKKIGKRGKFRPFILYGTLPLAITTVLCFLVPNLSMAGRIAFAYITYMLFGLAYSFVNIPYGSLAAAMTQDSVERTKLASFRQAGSNLAVLITGVAVIPLILNFSDSKVGYPVVMGLMALIGTVFHLICYKYTVEHVRVDAPEKKKEPISKMFKVLFSNKPLMILNLMSLLTISFYNLKVGMMVYYAQYVLGNANLTGTLNFVSIGCSLIGVAVMPLVVKKIGKKATFLVGLGIWVAGDLINYMLPGNKAVFITFSSIAWFGTAFMNGMTWAFISDAVEYGEWKTGERTEGIIYSTFSFCRKLAQALAGFIPGVVLSLIGYIPNVQQSAETLAGIKSLMLLYPAIGAGIAILTFVFLYNLTDDKYKHILAELSARKEAKAIQ